ncbi:uncharacterized protein [Lepeophtheirus salmonis]|uniref:BTB domain-containing protein n=1 Tax=Lepeophtheirus salmonis TaxID=72036 RepID=A0A0K2T654_LEPSM|nr:modifier of mdg4-like isoform X4 [Lepeophtheirus salmonis]
MDDHFTLQWNDYQNHLMNAFTSLRNDKDFVDLTLSCEGRKISSHKMLLSACSPYFRGLLKDNPCPHPVIILRQTSYEDLVAIIHFVYNGEVSLHQSRVKSFIKTAKSLKIRGLCEASEFGEEEEESVPSHEDQPQRKKVKLEDEEDEFGKDWTFDYGGSAGDIPDESSTPNAVIAEGAIRVCKIVPQTKRYAQKFRDKWLNDPEFEPWLSRHESDPEKAVCTVCRKTLNAKLYDLKHHSRSMRHRRNSIMEQGSGGLTEDTPDEERIYQTEEIIIKTTTSNDNVGINDDIQGSIGGGDSETINSKDVTLTHETSTVEITTALST